MEESEKRRERLKAMRMEAAQGGVDSSNDNVSHSLSNPLIEESVTASSTSTQRRFDYYTDPMSAFSGSKNRNNVPPHISHGHHYDTTPRMPPPPAYHTPISNPPGQMMYQAPPHYNQGAFQQAYSPLNRPEINFQNSWNNYPRGGNFTSPRFGQGNSSYVTSGQGRGQTYNYNPQHHPGRGQGGGRGRGQSWGNKYNPGSGPSSGSKSGSHNSVSAEIRPDLYYKKEMLEDPWKNLTPVIWRGVPGSSSNESWLPESISGKKAKLTSEASQRSIPRENLAEYLAAAFDDSVREDVDGEKDV